MDVGSASIATPSSLSKYIEVPIPVAIVETDIGEPITCEKKSAICSIYRCKCRTKMVIDPPRFMFITYALLPAPKLLCMMRP